MPARDIMDSETGEDDPVEAWYLQAMMALDRDLKCGRGFWVSINSIPPPPVKPDQVPVKMQAILPRCPTSPMSLPVVNLFHVPDHGLRQVIVDQMDADTSYDLTKYMESAVFGIQVYAGFAGAGKSETIGIVVAGMIANPHIKGVYVSAPTNVATDNIRNRIADVNSRCVALYNGKYTGASLRDALVIRGYSVQSEFRNFWKILRGEDMKPSPWDLGTWSLKGSVAFHALQVLGYVDANVPALSATSPVVLRHRQETLKGQEVFSPLLNLAQRKITVTEYDALSQVTRANITDIFEVLIEGADMICTTPSMAADKPYSLANRICSAVVLDEAGAMCLGDAEIVRGNTLRPCVMAGDEKQLPPVLISARDRAANRQPRNRFAHAGQISALEFMKRSGWPVFTFEKQYRMAEGQFDMSRDVFYPDLEHSLTYGPTSPIASRPISQQVEEWSTRRFSMSSPQGRTHPILLSSESPCHKDPSSSSSYNPGQNKLALTLIQSLVQDLALDPQLFTLITMYNKNKSELVHMLESSYPDIHGVECHTVDSFQGREARIIVLVLCVNAETGPRFTGDAQRLNVATSRQTDFLFVVGDQNTCRKVTARQLQGCEGEQGETMSIKVDQMQQMFEWFRKNDRIVITKDDCIHSLGPTTTTRASGKGKGKYKAHDNDLLVSSDESEDEKPSITTISSKLGRFGLTSTSQANPTRNPNISHKHDASIPSSSEPNTWDLSTPVSDRTPLNPPGAFAGGFSQQGHHFKTDADFWDYAPHEAKVKAHHAYDAKREEEYLCGSVSDSSDEYKVTTKPVAAGKSRGNSRRGRGSVRGGNTAPALPARDSTREGNTGPALTHPRGGNTGVARGSTRPRLDSRFAGLKQWMTDKP